jgi:hypothetical protein
MTRTSAGDQPREPRAPALEARGPVVLHPSPVRALHWLLLTFLLLGVVLWTSIPAFADPGHTPVLADGESHAARGATPDHCPGRPESGERGEVKVVEDEVDRASDDHRGLLASISGAEISTPSRAAHRISTLWWNDRLHSPPLTGAGCIRGPPGQRSHHMSI